MLWIAWDSAFHDTDLRIGDLVVALDQVPYTDVHDGNVSGSALGQPGETSAWERAGAQDGDEITLTVVRDGEEREIRGSLRAIRFYYSEEGRQALAPGGPVRLQTDGFDRAWSAWQEQVTRDWSYILCDGWNRANLNNRQALAEHLEHGPRVGYVEENHPGPFCGRPALRLRPRDRVPPWSTIRSHRGRPRLPRAGGSARGGGREGRRLRLGRPPRRDQPRRSRGLPRTGPGPPARRREQARGAALDHAAADHQRPGLDVRRSGGSSRDGFYFLDLEGRTAQRFYDVFFRYRGLVNPNLQDRYAFVGRVLDDPRMITYQRQPVTGLMVDIVAGRVGSEEGELFADLRGEPPFAFAGEGELRTLVQVGELADDLPPEGVVEVMIRSVQQADKETWKKTFADWRAWARPNGEAYLNRAYHNPDHVFERPFEQSRRSLSKDVHDSRVSSVGPIVTLCEEDRRLGTPRLQEVTVPSACSGSSPSRGSSRR